MADRALILTYHAVDAGHGPLRVDPELFGEQLDCLRDCGATTMILSELADGLASGALPPRAVAITFDDGLKSVVEAAGPAAHCSANAGDGLLRRGTARSRQPMAD